MKIMNLPVPNRTDKYAMAARSVRIDIRYLRGLAFEASQIDSESGAILLREISNDISGRLKIAQAFEAKSAELDSLTFEDEMDDEWNRVD